MPESKIQLTHRLQHEGRWGEATVFKDAEIARLRKEGMKRHEAGEAAWRAMAEKYPPIPAEAETCTSGGPGAPQAPLADEYFTTVTVTTPKQIVEDILWVYSALAVSHVKPEQAPSPGSWALLGWARKNMDRFMQQVLPRALGAKEEERAAIAQLDDSVGIEACTKILWDFEKECHKRLLESVPAVVRDKVESALQVWAVSHQLPASEAVERLNVAMVDMVADLLQCAANHPELLPPPGYRNKPKSA